MTPGPHEKHKGPHDHAAARAHNTPENAMRSVETCRSCLSALVPGRIWTHRAPHGEFEIKGSLMLDDKAVAILHFSPEDGSLLPKGLHALSEGKSGMLAVVEAKLKNVAQELTVLGGAEFREPESCWAVPLAHQGRIVGHMKVSADGNSMIADKKGTDEMSRLE